MPLPAILPKDYNLDFNDQSNNEKNLISTRYHVIKKIGSGNFGCAFLVKDKKKNITKDQNYKVLKQICVGPIDPGETVDAMNEARLLSKLKHSSIVQFFESFLSQHFFCIILEYCEGGDLEEAIIKQKEIGQQFEESQVISWLQQLLSGIEYMHSKFVLHRDLKARNIFLKNNDVKIGDFGISRILMGSSDKASTFVGTPYYMSPEVLNHEEYDEKCDIWSLGVVLYRLCSHSYPFDGTSLMNIMLKIVSQFTPSINHNYSRAMNNLLEKMFDRDPLRRPKAKTLLQHPLFNSTTLTSSSSVSNLTARDRLRLKKQKEADMNIEKLKTLAREKRMANARLHQMSKNKHLQATIFNESGENELFSSHKEVSFDDEDDLIESHSSDHCFNDTEDFSSSTLREDQIETEDDFDISTDKLIQTLIREGIIPEDEELANTLYSLHDDFEDESPMTSDFEEDEELSRSAYEYHEMLDYMEEALIMKDTIVETKKRSNSPLMSATLPQTSSDLNGAGDLNKITESVVDQRIANMRSRCEEMLGKEIFEQAYNCISKIRFEGNMSDKNELVMKDLSKIVPDTRKCMDLEQLIFLEQERLRSISASIKKPSSSHS